MIRSILLVLLSLLPVPCFADPAWQFIWLGESFSGEPGWKTSQGTAQVQIEKGKIRIAAFDLLGNKEPSLIIEGTIDSNGNIKATGTRTHSDEAPFQLSGALKTWNEEQIWGGHKKLVTCEEILFPLHPHHELYGFISRHVEDK